MNTGSADHPLFGMELHSELEAFLRDTNPWWQDRPMRPLPSFRRWLFEHTLQRLKDGLAPVTVLRGPRQVGRRRSRNKSFTISFMRNVLTPDVFFACNLMKFPPSEVWPM